jgi:hydroxymethylglutaryl-CoA synthase
MTGIVSYGFYIPQFRIKIEDIARMWGKKTEDITSSLGIAEKAVASLDEDSLTMAYESSSSALKNSSVKPGDIGAVFVGSESHPYAVNPTSTILAEFLGIEGQYLASDMQFACKAATGAMIAACGLVKSDFAKNILVCATDKATGRPHDALEYSAGSGSVALVLGNKDVAVEVVDYLSYSSDTPDFWRREGIRYPSHGGRFTGKPSYFHHVYNSSSALLKKTKMKPEDFDHCVFHMPNGKFPGVVAKSLGFDKKQIEKSLIVTELGNSYTASGLMGLVSVLEIAKPGELIFFASYGSGAGSDAFVLRTTKQLIERRKNLKQSIQNKTYIDYQTYLKFMNLI